MKIKDYISSLFSRKPYKVLKQQTYSYVDIDCGCKPFGKLIFLNCADLLTDIYAEVSWLPVLGYDTPKYRAWKRFVDFNGQRMLSDVLARNGYCVIGYKENELGEWVFWQMHEREFIKKSTADNEVVVVAKDPSVYVYILKSPTFEQTGISDYELCLPVVEYIDNALNASSTVCKRLGTVVIASPKIPASATMPLQLSDAEKQDLEKTLQTDYGALRKQNQIMLLPNEMTVQTVNLAGLDQKTQERVLTGVKIIADRLKVPANQIALIDATSSKSLANGTELREGDIAKYRTFRRLLNATLFDMTSELGLKVDYTIENEPKTAQGQSIEQV